MARQVYFVFCILYCIASVFLYFVFHIFSLFSFKSVLYEWRGKCRGGGDFLLLYFYLLYFLADFHNFLPFNFLIQKVFSMSGAASVGEAGRRLWPVVEFPQCRVEPADISSFLMCLSYILFLFLFCCSFFIFFDHSAGWSPLMFHLFLCAFFTFFTRVPMIFPLFIFVFICLFHILSFFTVPVIFPNNFSSFYIFFMCLFYIVLTTVPMILTKKLSPFSFSTTFLLFFSDSLYYIFYHSADDILQYLLFFFCDNVLFNVL